MVVHWCLGVPGVHSHDPLGSKDGTWGDDRRPALGKAGGANALPPPPPNKSCEILEPCYCRTGFNCENLMIVNCKGS